MDLLNIVSRQHKEWVKIVTSFGSSYPEDVVQDMYIRLHKYGQKEKILNENGEVNTFFIWIMLRNCFYDSNKLQKIEFLNLDSQFNVIDTSDESEKTEAFNKLFELIEKETSNWHHYDKLLFDIYRKKQMSIRQIAKESNINYTSIFHTLKHCKSRIRKEVGESYDDYLNEDFELI